MDCAGVHRRVASSGEAFELKDGVEGRERRFLRHPVRVVLDQIYPICHVAAVVEDDELREFVLNPFCLDLWIVGV